MIDEPTDEPKARAAFLAAAHRIYAGVADSSLRTVDDAALAAPGFTAYEVQAQVPVRGYARGDEVVMARQLSFGPLLDAIGFDDAAKLPSPDGAVRRLVWLFGPPYQPIAQLAEGEYGAPDEFDLTPQLDRYPDGSTVLMFALLDPGGGGVPSTVFQVRVHHSASRGYRVVTEQLAPKPAD